MRTMSIGTLISQPVAASAESPVGWLGRLDTLLRRGVAGLVHAASRRRDIRVLSQMDERLLRDIGLLRCDLQNLPRRAG